MIYCPRCAHDVIPRQAADWLYCPRCHGVLCEVGEKEPEKPAPPPDPEWGGDPLLPQVIEMMPTNAEKIEKKLRVGYNRAMRLLREAERICLK